MSGTGRPMNTGGGADGHQQHQTSETKPGNRGPLPGSRARANPVHRRATSRKRTSPAVATSVVAQRPRRDRGPNWTHHEMFAPIDSKREEYMDELDCVDARDLMESDTTKWERIVVKVMAAGYSPCLRDHTMCKGKWNLIILEYRRIADYHACTGTNRELYWSQTAQQHVQEGLPKSFSRDMYARIDEWFGQRPQMLPPHVRDLLSPRDANYEEVNDGSDKIELPGNDPTSQGGDGRTFSTPTASPQQVHRPTLLGYRAGMSPSEGAAADGPSANPPLVSLSPGRGTVPPTQLRTIILSSSESAGTSARRRPGSTGIRRKSPNAQLAIAEAAKSTGEVMVAQMKEMVGATKETESNKLQVQLRLFSENMLYQREKDQRLYEQAQIATENARLAILKQGELVACLTNISKVLSKGLKVTQDEELHTGTGLVPCPEQEVNKECGIPRPEGSGSAIGRDIEDDM